MGPEYFYPPRVCVSHSFVSPPHQSVPAQHQLIDSEQGKIISNPALLTGWRRGKDGNHPCSLPNPPSPPSSATPSSSLELQIPSLPAWSAPELPAPLPKIWLGMGWCSAGARHQHMVRRDLMSQFSEGLSAAMPKAALTHFLCKEYFPGCRLSLCECPWLAQELGLHCPRSIHRVADRTRGKASK